MNDMRDETQSFSCDALTRADMARTEAAMCANLSSASESTGMIATPPLSDADLEGYETLFYRTQLEANNAREADSPEEQKRREYSS